MNDFTNGRPPSRLWEEEQEDLLFRIFTLSGKNLPPLAHHTIYPQRISGTAVCICLKGEATIYIDHGGYVLRPNDMFVLFPDAVFKSIQRSDDFVAFMVGARLDHVTSTETLASAIPLYFHMRENPCISLQDDDVQRIVELGELVKKRIRHLEHPYRKDITRHLMTALFYDISSMYEQGQPVIQQSRKRDEELYEKFLYLVMQHCTTERRLEFYAEQLFLTPKYLSSVIKQVSGKSASEWIGDAVILNAKSMLRSSSLTVQQISNELNFPNPSFFGQYFKKHTGMTPKDFRHYERTRSEKDREIEKSIS